MQLKTSVIVFILSIGSIILLNSGCNGGKSSSSSFGSFDIPSTAPPSPPAVVGPEGASRGLVSDTDFFYIGVKAGNDEPIVHVRDVTLASNDFSKACAISTTAQAQEDISCMIDVPEGELFSRPLSLTVNTPEGMCRYLERETYWFYNKSVGVGPAAITISIDNTVNASGDITGTTYNCNIDGVAAPSCTGLEIKSATLSENPSFTCTYDESAGGGKNCCTGSVEITKVVLTNGASADTTVATNSWGGRLNDCIGGPGKTDWAAYTVAGLPKKLVTPIKSGVGTKFNYVITAPIDVPNITTPHANIHVANYFGGSATHTHQGWVDLRSTDLPYFMDPVDDLDGSLIAPSNTSYSFKCLNAAFEVEHRIRVTIREWDVVSDFNTYISSLGTIEIPDRSTSLLDPPEDVPTCGGLAGYCNDIGDADDLLNVSLILNGPLPLPLPGYETSPVSTYGPERPLYFPNIPY